jgi:hypothetical protein
MLVVEPNHIPACHTSTLTGHGLFLRRWIISQSYLKQSFRSFNCLVQFMNGMSVI